jgi:type I restriction enzyme S subunit
MTDFLQKLLNGQKVEWKKLGEVCELKRGTTITEKTKTDGDIPVISGGQKPAYYNGEYNRDGETITVAGSGAYAGHLMYWSEPIFVSDAFSVKPNLDLLNTRYVYHFLINNQSWIYNLKKCSGVPLVYPKDLATLPIPLPPLHIQEEIVRILDTLTTHTAELKTELTAELEARRKQYTHYREKLLTFGAGVEWKKLGEVCEVQRGSRLTKKELSDEYQYPVFHGGLIPLGYYNQYNRKANQTMIINTGSIGEVVWSGVNFWSSDGTFVIKTPDEIDDNFLYFFVKQHEAYFKSPETPLIPSQFPFRPLPCKRKLWKRLTNLMP